MSARPQFRVRRCASRDLFLALVTSLALFASLASGATLGFVERFPGTSLQGWTGGSFQANPGTGGLAGAGDGFLSFKTPNGSLHNLGVRTSEAP